MPVSRAARDIAHGGGRTPAAGIRHVVLSPHIDDAALSCGGSAHRWAVSGERVLVVNVMTGDPPRGGLSGFAGRLHARWGVAPDEAYAHRRAEDTAALDVLGADSTNLAFPDCIYRTAGGAHLYDTEEALFGPVHAADAPTEAAIARSLLAVLRDAEAGTRLYAPLGVGNHVDHQLVRRAAIAVWPGPLWFYQDFPYAAVPGALAAALCAARAGAGGGESVGPAELPVAARAVALRREDVRARVRAVTCYRSQIAVLFGSPYGMARAIWRDARSGAALAPDSEPGASPPSARGAEGHARDSRLELAETFWFAR